MFCEILEHPTERLKAFSLLHEVYIGEQHWEFPKNNLSKLLISEIQNTPILTDEFDTKSTIFGVYHQNELIASCRIIEPSDKGLEISRYKALPQKLEKGKSFEVNRLAVKKKYRGSNALFLLAYEVFTYCKKKQIDYLIAAATFPMPGLLYTRIIGFEKVDTTPFKYNKGETQDAIALFLNFKDYKKIDSLIQKFKEKTLVLA